MWCHMQHSDSRTKATAHSGILRAAKGVVDDLVHEGVLAALMEGKPVPPTNRKTPDCRCVLWSTHRSCRDLRGLASPCIMRQG